MNCVTANDDNIRQINYIMVRRRSPSSAVLIDVALDLCLTASRHCRLFSSKFWQPSLNLRCHLETKTRSLTYSLLSFGVIVAFRLVFYPKLHKKSHLSSNHSCDVILTYYLEETLFTSKSKVAMMWNFNSTSYKQRKRI